MKNKEIEELLNELKDKECYYVGTNGCLYQDLTKEEINLILSYIEQLEEELKEEQEESYKQTEWLVKKQKKIEQLENNRDKAIKILGNYKHYSTPTEEQNSENEKIVDDVYNLLSGYKYKMNELEGKDNNE